MTALPRNVIFDVGNVLLAWRPKELVETEVRDPGLHGRVLDGIFQHDDWTRLDEGVFEEEEANERFAERTGLDLPEIRRLILASKASLAPLDEGQSLLRELHGQGVALYCLTNMARGTFDFVHERYDFWQYFRGILVSALVRLIKPDPRIFERIVQTYGLDPAETVFLDDNAANVESARRVGLTAHLWDDPARVRQLLLSGAS